MAWIEQRRRKHVVHHRADGRKVKGPSFDTAEEAALFVELVGLVGWDGACAYLDAPDEQAPRATRSAVPLPPPQGLRPAGVSVGDLTRLHIGSLTVRPRTRRQYHAYVRVHVDPFFGDLDAGYVIRHDHPRAQGTCAKSVTAWRDWMSAHEYLTRTGQPTGRTLSAKTMKNIISLVATAYAQAMRDDFAPLVDRNPFTGMSPRQTAPDDVERVHLTPSQFTAFLSHVIAHYRSFFLFLVLTGLRWGEAAGLRVRDVTVKPETGRPYLEIRTALTRAPGGGVTHGWLKSKAARRRLTIPEALLPVVRDAIKGKGPDDPVFTSPQGAPLHHGNVARNLAKAIARAHKAGADVPQFTLHSLRHTCAAWLLSAGRTPYQVSRQLGHETEATTMKFYGHLVRAEYDVNADTLQDVLSGAGWSLPDHVAAAVEPSRADLRLVGIATADVEGNDTDPVDSVA